MKFFKLFILFFSFFCFEMKAKAAVADAELRWVSDLVNQHPELLWLADSHVKKTEEGDSSKVISASSWSEALFGKKYDEFERTMMSLLCLKMILEDDYIHFTEGQPTSSKLDPSSFHALHQKGLAIIKESGMPEADARKALNAALILGDMGKVPYARTLVNENGFTITAPDHDDFIDEAIKQCPHLFPTFNQLSPKAKEVLQKSFGLAHFGHITHLEGGAEMFANLKSLEICRDDPFLLKFAYFIHTCDVSGALGHLTNRYSKVLTQETYRALNAVEQAVHLLKSGNEYDAYFAYLQKRAEWLGYASMDREHHLLTRLGASLRLFSPAQGKILEKGFRQLKPEDQENALVYLLNITKATYVPSVFVNMCNSELLGKTWEERMVKTLEISLPFVSDVLRYRQAGIYQGLIEETLILNFNPVAGIVKKDPYCLLARKFSVTSDGLVHVFESKQK